MHNPKSEIFGAQYDLEKLEPGSQLSKAETAALVSDFLKNGWVMLPAKLSNANVIALRKALIRKSKDPVVIGDTKNDFMRGVGYMRMFEYSLAFRDLIATEPIIGIVEAILGGDCHVLSQNALRTPQGSGIARWHIDGELLFPDMDSYQEGKYRCALPCHSLSVMVPLTDVDNERYGPTQVVPTSHLSGLLPNHDGMPSFNHTEPATIYGTAGSIYLINHQCWHRGTINTSRRIRLMSVTAYGKRFMQQRFYPFLNYKMPSHMLDGCSEHLLRLLGKHNKGPLG